MASTHLICVVDDHADYRFLLKQLFDRYLPAYLVCFFDGGQALLAALPKLHPKPGLILLDRHMPHLDGHQTLMALKDHSVHKTFPVVMMSSESSALEINSCYEAGANSFIIKKLDLQSMKAMLEAVCHYWLETNQQLIES